MNRQAQAQVDQSVQPTMSKTGRWLQRQCACGTHTIAGGQCQDCDKNDQFNLQTKLKVSQSGIVFKKEADHIADQVTATPAHTAVNSRPSRGQHFAGQLNAQMGGTASVGHAIKAKKSLDVEENDAIKLEIDRRYYESMQEAQGAKIKRSEKGKAVISNSLMQEVLEDKKKLEQLPDTIKSLLCQSNFTPENYHILTQIGETLSKLSDNEIKSFFAAGPSAETITLADCPQLLRIAKKLSKLSPEARQDYLDRVNTSTTTLNGMEKSIDKYIRFLKKREEQVIQHETVAKPLLFAENLYESYQKFKDEITELHDPGENYRASTVSAITELDTLLKHKNFDSLSAFEKAIESYRVAFRTQAVNLALDVLARYDHMLFEERKALKQPGAASDIAESIRATKASEYYKKYHEYESYKRLISTASGMTETWSYDDFIQFNKATDDATKAKESAEKEVLSVSGGHPLIKERGIDLEKLAGTNAEGVQSYLEEQISKREADVETSRTELKDDPDRVFSLPDLVAATKMMLGVNSDTVYGRIIDDYINDSAELHLLSSIAIGTFAIILAALVPVGGWIAAASLVAGAGLTTYLTYQEYEEYKKQERDYELGFLSDEPSLFWVWVAIAGAALEIGTTVFILVKKSAAALISLKDSMRQFAKDGKIPTLLNKIEKTKLLNEKLRDSLMREAKATYDARKAFKEFSSSVGSATVGSFGGQIGEGSIHLFRFFYHRIRQGISTIEKLSAEAEFLKIMGDLTKMSGAKRDELVAAFQEVEKLVRAAPKGMDELSLGNFVERWAINRGKPGFQTKLHEELVAWKPPTKEQISALKKLETQRVVVDDLIKELEDKTKELKDLKEKAKTGLNDEELERIRELPEELYDLEPKPDLIVPNKQKKGSKGKIYEAKHKLQQLLEEALEEQISLYDRMRSTRPSDKARQSALKRSIDGLPLRSASVDHIVSIREICDMDGFADLPLKYQKAIINMEENLIGMELAANISKNDLPWGSWRQASQFYKKINIDKMVELEGKVRRLIQDKIKESLKLQLKP